MKLYELITWFKNYDYQGNELIIRENEKINDLKKTVESFVFILEEKGIEGCYSSYYKTLLEIYKQLN